MRSCSVFAKKSSNHSVFLADGQFHPSFHEDVEVVGRIALGKKLSTVIIGFLDSDLGYVIDRLLPQIFEHVAFV